MIRDEALTMHAAMTSPDHQLCSRHLAPIVPVILLTVGLLIPETAAAQDDWEKLPDMPVEKWEPGTVVLDNKLYLFGGYTEGVRSSKLSHVFDPRDNSWTRIQDLPSAITHMNMVLDGRTVWFAGGYKDGYKGHTIAEVWSYDIDGDRYTAAPLLPETRGGGGLALVGRQLHYMGGVKADRDTDAPDHWVLDLDEWARGAAQWTSAAPMPVPRNQFSCVTFDGKIYAIGGQFHHDSEQLDQARVDIYAPDTDTWSSGPPLPKGHSHAEGGTFVHRGRIYMVGGHTTKPGETKQVDPNILALTPRGEWELVATLPMPLSSPAAAIIDGRLYVGGGSPGSSAVQADMWVRTAP
ncbi:MAG: hypothetical protein CL477_15990 [Acidobacteria bacterium]|nr:hypothetical protein [Acidobacteriota bacterium]